MFNESAPRDYVTGKYLEYQKRYAQKMRESDRVMLRLIEDVVSSEPRLVGGGKLRLL